MTNKKNQQNELDQLDLHRLLPSHRTSDHFRILLTEILKAKTNRDCDNKESYCLGYIQGLADSDLLSASSKPDLRDIVWKIASKTKQLIA